ncbi:hypothetical protein KSP40_PGU000774 [Platanthera guangdongensis]|uniref:Uncharacterized protein n=1 Tax=Platanthera guangdongensis TaxID=2320717 RepID=A0ABR2LUE0_9ASPA
MVMLLHDQPLLLLHAIIWMDCERTHHLSLKHSPIVRRRANLGNLPSDGCYQAETEDIKGQPAHTVEGHASRGSNLDHGNRDQGTNLTLGARSLLSPGVLNKRRRSYHRAAICASLPTPTTNLPDVLEERQYWNYGLNDASRDPSHTCFSSQNGDNISLKASRPALVVSSTSWKSAHFSDFSSYSQFWMKHQPVFANPLLDSSCYVEELRPPSAGTPPAKLYRELSASSAAYLQRRFLLAGSRRPHVPSPTSINKLHR